MECKVRPRKYSRKVYCPGKTTSATHQRERVGGMGEPKSEVHACFTSKQPQGCGASTTAVRKSEFEERGRLFGGSSEVDSADDKKVDHLK